MAEPEPITAQAQDAVDRLLRRAFATGAEADLVRQLRRDGALAHEITETVAGGLAGYAALSWMAAPQGWLCLAPVAVDPDRQRRGIGTRLVRRALDWAGERALYVVVLGDLDYYGARGFSSARAARLTSPYPVSHMLLAGPGEDAPAGTLTYPEAFRDAG